MKEIFKPLEPYGFEQDIIGENEEIPEGWTNIFPLQPCYKPYFNGIEWIELAKDDEIEEVLSHENFSEIEILKHENAELKHNQEIQNQAIADIGEMLAEIVGE